LEKSRGMDRALIEAEDIMLTRQFGRKLKPPSTPPNTRSTSFSREEALRRAQLDAPRVKANGAMPVSSLAQSEEV
jgi:hypothetical protein